MGRIIMINYKNPVVQCEKDGHTADPHIVKWNGYYYHCYCRCDDNVNGVYISKSENLWDIGKGTEVKVFDANKEGETHDWYAPELHRIDGAWYIYGAPAFGDDNEFHTMCVLENKSDDPQEEYAYLGPVKGLENIWSIDGTILNFNDENWFVWTNCSEMYISKMINPWSIEDEHTVIAKPKFDFETKTEVLVNEGPAVLYRNEKIHIVYSANDSKTDEYCLGLLTYSGGKINDPKNWVKYPETIFSKTEAIFGPGHCSFTIVNENGEEKDYIVYHANLESCSGWDGRSVWVQEFSWDEKDMPIFGAPHK